MKTKTKILFITGISIFGALVTYALGCLIFSVINDPWGYKSTWMGFYVFSAIAILAFLLIGAFKTYDIIKKSNASRMDSLAGILGGLGCALLTFGGTFAWYAVNHPKMSNPFVSVEAARVVYISYAIITVLILISAAVLKIMATVKDETE